MTFEQLSVVVTTNSGTLIFALLGAWILSGISIKEHLDRDPKDKMSRLNYVIYLLGWVFGYPLMGFIVAVAYLGTDNQFGAWLALQIGLTSPAIVAGLASSGANALSKKGIDTAEEQ